MRLRFAPFGDQPFAQFRDTETNGRTCDPVDAYLAGNAGDLLKVLLSHSQPNQKALAIGIGNQQLHFLELGHCFDPPFTKIAVA